jgi:hypothetical protein
MKAKYKAKRVPKKAKLTKPLKEEVKKMIHGESENKMISTLAPFTAGLLTSLVNPAINAPLSTQSAWVRLIPSLAQGTGMGQRVGNRVRPISCTLRIAISTSYSQASVDLLARIFIVSDKSVKSYNIENPSVGVTTINYQKLLDGGGSPTQYIGDAVSNLLPVNTNQFVKHTDRLVHLVKSNGVETNASSPFAGDNSSATTSTLYYATIKVPLPKVLKYDQNLDTFPSNAAPYLCIGYAYMNGALVYPNVIGFTALSTLVYEDA